MTQGMRRVGLGGMKQSPNIKLLLDTDFLIRLAALLSVARDRAKIDLDDLPLPIKPSQEQELESYIRDSRESISVITSALVVLAE